MRRSRSKESIDLLLSAIWQTSTKRMLLLVMGVDGNKLVERIDRVFVVCYMADFNKVNVVSCNGCNK